MTTKNPEANVRILKIHSCPSVSGKSTLTYHIGCTEDGNIQFRIHANTNAGFFSNEWLSLSTIQQALAKVTEPFTSVVLAPLFRGKSANTSAFMVAALLQEGLIQRAGRSYERSNVSGFMAEVNALMDSDIALNADDKPRKAPSQVVEVSGSLDKPAPKPKKTKGVSASR